MEIRIDRDSKIPLFVQISEQLRHLILSGRYPAGTKLPSSRELAEFLQVTRNTISNALEVLRQEDLLEIHQGIGVLVKAVPTPPVQEISESLKSIASQALRNAREIGYNENDLIEAIQMVSHNPTALPISPESDKYIVFVECNKPILETYKADIETSVGVKVVPYLLDDLRDLDPVTQIVLNGCECVTTTSTHLYDTKNILAKLNKPILGITVAPYIALQLQVSSWPRDSRVLVIMIRKYGAESVVRSLSKLQPPFFSITPTGLDDAALKDLIVQSTHLVITRQAMDIILPLITPDKEYAIYENHLENAGVDLLKKFLSQSSPD